MDLQSLPRTQPSWHRRQLLRVAKMLSKEDVDEITYLAEDFLHPSEAARISTGLDLMRCLEWHGRVGPGNYGYLLSCLREIGRIDIEMSFLKSASSIPFTPHSFGAMFQMFATTKMSILHAKQKQYTANMTNCTLTAESDAMEVLIPTLQDIFTAFSAWNRAIGDLEHHRSSATIVESMERAGKHIRRLCSSWDSINWMKQWRDQVSFQQRETHSVGAMPINACSFFCELGSEVFGVANTPKEAEKLSQALFIVESASYMTIHAYGIINWLTSLCELVVATETNIEHHKPHLKALLSQNAEVISKCNPILEQIFQGTAVLERLQAEGLLGKQHTRTESKAGYSSCMVVAQCALPVTLLVLLNSDIVTPSDWVIIHTHLLKHFKERKQAFRQAYLDIVFLMIHTLQHELDHFQDRVA